ncbi:MAG: amidohydrolase [Planctomycetota bacterium]|nr:amidohydrolase [Planctomycetota bacterium]
MDRASLKRTFESAWQSLRRWEIPFDQAVSDRENEFIRIRRQLHAHPEPSWEERRTTRYLADLLRGAGLEPRVCDRDVGLFVDLAVGTPAADAPLIAMRADIDALRITDEKDVEYKSTMPGVSHACGHDAHSAIACGAALTCRGLTPDGSDLAAADPESATSGMRLRFLFQPAEESAQGAEFLVEQGAMQGVDFALGLHVDPERTVGTVGIRYGALTAYCDEVEIVVTGQGGHGARPFQSNDPITAAAQLINALHVLLPRSVDARDPSVFTVGRIAGGHASNVIPDSVCLNGTIRAAAVDTRDTIRRRLREIAAGTAQSTGTQIEVNVFNSLDGVLNDPAVTSAMESSALRVVGDGRIDFIDKPSLGGEDFSMYLKYAPGAMLRLGCTPPDASPRLLHTTNFDIDDRALAVGVKILVKTAMLLSVPEVQRALKSTDESGNGITFDI